MNPNDISFDHLPLLQEEEVRERVRAGEELSVGSLSLGYVAPNDLNILTKLREFSAQELVVHKDGIVMGRLERRIPSPLPAYADRILALCTGHIHEIRTRCNAILRTIAAKERTIGENPSERSFFHRITQGTRIALVNIEQSIQRIRNGLEASLYHEFMHDTFHEEEFLTQVETHVHEQYEQEKQILAVLEQPLGLP